MNPSPTDEQRALAERFFSQYPHEPAAFVEALAALLAESEAKAMREHNELISDISASQRRWITKCGELSVQLGNSVRTIGELRDLLHETIPALDSRLLDAWCSDLLDRVINASEPSPKP